MGSIFTTLTPQPQTYVCQTWGEGERLLTIYSSAADPEQTGLRMAEPDRARTVSCVASVFGKRSPSWFFLLYYKEKRQS